ncbi:MAG: CocE/NonD family hydrolase [Actinomycetota bacterium]|nr:CocE/NonD family hydrolase [Actinomycetota bacterium]
MTISRSSAARLLSLLIAAFCLVALLPALPAAAAESYEVHHVKTVDGAVIRVEIRRDKRFDAAKQPVILTYSPYNSLSEPQPADDSVADRYVPLGYARAVADVLGTRGSTGCWDYGGRKEQQSGVDVVKYLARQPWSSGKVAMMGGSYNGTTATMVAARGTDVPQLKAIIPIAGISRWYGYAYGNGARYFLNSQVPTDEGFDTPLAFDVGFAKTVAVDPMGQEFADTLRARAAECGAVEHTDEGYSRNPDYDSFWLERDYRKDAAKIRAAVLIAHGWQDYNVKQEEGTTLYEAVREDNPATTAVEGAAFKRLYLAQGSHSGGTRGEQWQPLLDRFLAKTLKGVNNGVDREDEVLTQGRTFAGPQATFKSERRYPAPGTKAANLWLRRSFDTDEIPGVTLPPPGTSESGALSRKPNTTTKENVFTYVDSGAATEEVSTRDPLNEFGHGYYSLYYKSLPLAKNTRISGAAEVDAYVRNSTAGQHLTPVLLDVAPDGTAKTVERGFLHLSYRNGLAESQPSANEWVNAKARLLPQDYTFAKGHRIALLVQSSNTVWAVPGAVGTMNVANGRVPDVTAVGSKLSLPVVGGELSFTQP